MKVGNRVKIRRPRDERDAARRGTITEIEPNRVRVLWDTQSNGTAPKRTWLKPEAVEFLEGSL